MENEKQDVKEAICETLSELKEICDRLEFYYRLLERPNAEKADAIRDSQSTTQFTKKGEVLSSPKTTITTAVKLSKPKKLK